MTNNAEIRALLAVVAVGDGGRGSVVRGYGHNNFIVTAAHCLPFVPPRHLMSYLRERTYPGLVTRLGGIRAVWVECLFMDLIADIALLGPPDSQALDKRHTFYQRMIDTIEPLAISAPPPRARKQLQAFDGTPISILTSGSAPARVLSLENTWLDCTVTHSGGSLSVSGAEIVGGMSGSPIMAMDGTAIGVISTNGGPCLMHDLPGWYLQQTRGRQARKEPLQTAAETS